MSYTLIKGEFHIFYPDIPRQGPEPDGDTVKFRPDNPILVERLERPGGIGPDFNGRGMINLRLEGIDALETHFDDMHQNLDLALAARDALLQRLGFGAVTFWPDLPFKVQTVEQHPRRGYVLAKTLEGHGRVVAFVYAGDPPQVDGADVWLDDPTLDASLNTQLLADGMVYPLFYTTLPVDLTQHLTAIAIQAREGGRGLWPSAIATVENGVEIRDLATVEQLVIWPKLFRRLAHYFAAGNVGLAQFDAWLRADPTNRDDRLILPSRELGNMHDIIHIEGDTLRMVYQPEDLIIVPDDTITGGPGPVPPSQRGAVRIVGALVNPAGADMGHEVVTILNTTPEPIELTGWSIADRSNHRQPLQAVLAPGAVVQVTLSSHVQLGNNGATITLFNVAGEQVDQVSYTQKQAQREGWTIVF